MAASARPAKRCIPLQERKERVVFDLARPFSLHNELAVAIGFRLRRRRQVLAEVKRQDSAIHTRFRKI
ncbi:MAG: hypothetical protein OJF51_002586 [Nitrospira sp.]|nr:MAG: hypothetical protein OJF51_002586 [Nitrospira sp.]